MSSKDVVVVVKLEEVDTSVASLDILLISTAGAKDVKTYTDPEDIAKDYTAESAVYKKAKVMMGQGKAKPTPASLIKKVKVVGFAEPESPEALVNAIMIGTCSLLISMRTPTSKRWRHLPQTVNRVKQS